MAGRQAALGRDIEDASELSDEYDTDTTPYDVGDIQLPHPREGSAHGAPSAAVASSSAHSVVVEDRNSGRGVRGGAVTRRVGGGGGGGDEGSGAQPGPRDSEVEQFLRALEGIGEEAALRLMRAQLRTMQDELTATQTELKHTKSKVSALDKELKQSAAERAKLEKSMASVKADADKSAAAADDAVRRANTAETLLKASQKELDDLRRAQKKTDSQSGTLQVEFNLLRINFGSFLHTCFLPNFCAQSEGIRSAPRCLSTPFYSWFLPPTDHHHLTAMDTRAQVRLNRANEELDAARREVQRLRQGSSSTGGELRTMYDSALKQSKVLAAQKDELLAAFRKQQQLIDVLKRQKLHVEAARVLQFSEEEFVKALDWGA